jgi:Ca2+/H+ antiporter
MRGSQGLFWGIFLIGIGVLMIIKYQFKLNISMPRIIIGVLLLALGISMLLGGPGVKTQSSVIFSEGNVQAVKPEK